MTKCIDPQWVVIAGLDPAIHRQACPLLRATGKTRFRGGLPHGCIGGGKPAGSLRYRNGPGMASDLKTALKTAEALDLWRLALTESVRRETPDLSARQLALLLTVYLTQPPHTVRGLAAALNISKPAITRALDRLSVLGFIRRKIDREDRRNVLVQRTVKGSVYLSEFADLVRAAALSLDAPAEGD
jgi:DNA-binding MarR family transcriptional regulator